MRTGPPVLLLCVVPWLAAGGGLRREPGQWDRPQGGLPVRRANEGREPRRLRAAGGRAGRGVSAAPGVSPRGGHSQRENAMSRDESGGGIGRRRVILAAAVLAVPAPRRRTRQGRRLGGWVLCAHTHGVGLDVGAGSNDAFSRLSA